MSRIVTLAARQALMEQRTFWRSAEYALFTFALPLALLLLIGSTTANGDLPGTHVEGQMIFVPSIIAFGVIVAAYVNLGAKLATLRHDGVLKRIRTTPAARERVPVRRARRARPPPRSRSPRASWPSARSPSARSRARAACRRSPAASSSASSASAPSASRSARSPAAPSRPSPIANASYLPIAIMSGIFDPTFSVPRWLSAAVVACSRSAPSPRSSSRATPRSSTPRPTDLFVLLAWTAAGCAFAAWRFRWH